MKKLKNIIKKTEANTSDRRNKLRELADELGVSIIGTNNSAERDDENVLIERIERKYLVVIAGKNWILALVASIASIISALAAWTAILK